jgi:16S rRNA (cytosine967-C5)-methyltransferase
VYATCSLLRAENEDVAAWFAAAYAADFEPWPLDEADGAFARTRPPPELPHAAAARSNERTLLPHLHGTDGFFVARWRRRG